MPPLPVPQYIYQDSKTLATIQLWYIRFLPGWSVTRVRCILLRSNVALPKRPINRFQPVWQSRKQALRASCPNVYTVACPLHCCGYLHMQIRDGKTISKTKSHEQPFRYPAHVLCRQQQYSHSQRPRMDLNKRPYQDQKLQHDNQGRNHENFRVQGRRKV